MTTFHPLSIAEVILVKPTVYPILGDFSSKLTRAPFTGRGVFLKLLSRIIALDPPEVRSGGYTFKPHPIHRGN